MLKFLMLLVAFSPVVFLVGLIKPKWILFWMKEPDRIWASGVGLLMFMATFTAYSEMRVRHKTAEEVALGHKPVSPEKANDLNLGGAR
mgnify:CR=1 FL=1